MTISTCRSCGEDIIWVRTPSGNAMPLNAQADSLWVLEAEGAQVGSPRAKPVQVRVSHFSTCVGCRPLEESPMSVDIARLRELDLDYRGDVDPHDSAEEVMEMLPAIIAELERWRCATYSATPEALSEDVANSVLEHVEVMSELERLRRFEAAMLAIEDEDHDDRGNGRLARWAPELKPFIAEARAARAKEGT